MCPRGFFFWFTLVPGGCKTLRRWEQAHSSVMRLTCASITKVMMSFLDGEVAAADSFHQQGEIPPEGTAMQLNCRAGSPFFCRTVAMEESGVAWKAKHFVAVYCESELPVVLWCGDSQGARWPWCVLLVFLEKICHFDYWLWRPVILYSAERAQQSVNRFCEQVCLASAYSDSWRGLALPPMVTCFSCEKVSIENFTPYYGQRCGKCPSQTSVCLVRQSYWEFPVNEDEGNLLIQLKLLVGSNVNTS